MVGELYMRVDSRISANSRLTFIVFSAIIVLLTLFYCYWVGWKGYVGEAEMYNFGYADAIFNGIAPFTPFEDLRWEYPPLAYLLFLPPRLFASDPQSYVFAFAVEVAVFCIIGLWIMMRIARSMGRNYTGVLLTYVISIFILNYFIFDRFDIIVAVIALGAVSMFMEKRYSWATVLLVIGMFMKLYPALLLPIFLIILYNRGQRMEAARQFAIFAVLSVLIMVPFVLMASGNAWNFLEYHSDRGLQIESVAASLILLADLFGLTSTSWNNSFGSFNLGGDLADSVAEIMMPLMIVVILLAYVLYFRKTDVEKGNDDGSGLVAAVALVVLLFVVFNKVFSAQYVIWIMLAVLPLCFFTSPRFSRTICLYVLLMMVLTYCMEEFYDDLMNVESTGIAFLFIRNVLVVIMTAHIFHEAGYIDTIRGWLHRTQDS